MTQRRWWRWPVAVAVLIAIGSADMVIDHAVLSGQSWADCATRGVAAAAGVVAISLFTRWLNRKAH